MATIPIDAMLRVKMFFAITGSLYDRTLNVLHFRNTETGDDETLYLEFGEQFQTVVITPMLANMATTTNLMQVRYQLFLPNELYEHVEDFDPGEKSGSLAVTGSANAHSRAACLIRRSYAPGRRGVGRTFFGPLHTTFIDGDNLVVDPNLAGDLNDVQAAFEAQLGTESAGIWRPNIYGPPASGSTQSLAQRDQRTTAWAPLVSTLRSRRPGKGS